MSEIERLLSELSGGRESALDELFLVVYGELRQRAASFLPPKQGGHTLQPTALVHEAFMKLSKQEQLEFKDEAHFYAVAATAMRQILVDHARRKQRLKRGGAGERVGLDESVAAGASQEPLWIELDAALRELGQQNERLVRVVELRYLAGRSVEEVALILGVGTATVKRDWQTAREWLASKLGFDPKRLD